MVGSTSRHLAIIYISFVNTIVYKNCKSYNYILLIAPVYYLRMYTISKIFTTKNIKLKAKYLNKKKLKHYCRQIVKLNLIYPFVGIVVILSSYI